MKLYYAVKDLAVQAFGTPFLVRTKGEAMRSFMDEVNSGKPDSAIAQHPEDYELYEIGQYNDELGTINGYEEPEFTARAKDLLTRRDA